MTIAQVLTEITSRCGEGYENYSSRAKSALMDVIRGLTQDERIPDEDIPGLRFSGVYPVDLAVPKIAVSAILTEAGLTDGKIRYLKYSSGTRATVTTTTGDENGNLKFTAKYPGTSGNTIKIVMLEDEPYIGVAYSASETAITIGYDTDATAADVVEKFTDLDALALVSIALADEEDGSGNVRPFSGALSGGTGGAFIPMERISKAEYEASLFRSDIVRSPTDILLYYIEGDGEYSYIQLPRGSLFGAGSVVEYDLVGFDSQYFENTANVISRFFSPSILERIISEAASMLQREILS